MDSGRASVFTGGLKRSPESAIDESGFLGTRRGLRNIRWYEYTFLMLGILAALITDGLTIGRIVNTPIGEPDFAYGILILVHSIFLLLFLITGIFYQRISDIIAFFISAVLLTIYVIAHYFARKLRPDDTGSSQNPIRLTRLIFTIVFNILFIPLAIIVIKDYRRDEFSKRLFGAFPTARRPLKIYSIFDCVARINTMLSISSLLLNLYNYNGYETLDKVLVGIGIPLTLLWLLFGIGMARLENRLLALIFYFLSLFQIGFLIYSFYTGINYSTETTTQSPLINLVPILNVLYVCISANLITHITSIIFGILCMRNFNQGLKEKVFNNKFDKWFQERWSK